MTEEQKIETNRSSNHVVLNNQGDSTPTLFLHGFTGTGDSWKEIVSKLDRFCIAPDIVGHGKSSFNDIDSDYTIDDWCDDLSQILDSLKVDRLNICGYSMGGRLAISFASKYPDRIERLILESTSLGIKDNNAKKERYQEDLKLCKLIESDYSKFIRGWESSPLFLNQEERNKPAFLKQRKERLSHSPTQLSKALEVFSQGKIKSYEKEFSKFNFPILIINGSDDLKYTLAGEKMSEINKQATQDVVDNTNHNVHLESIDAFIGLIK